MLGSDPSVVGLRGLIANRTGGNPFFIEEIVRSLVESGSLEGTAEHYRLRTPVDQLEVPASVQSVLAARIDSLPEREKRLLQTAAVIGKEFSQPTLDAVERLTAEAILSVGGKLDAYQRMFDEEVNSKEFDRQFDAANYIFNRSEKFDQKAGKLTEQIMKSVILSQSQPDP